MDYNPRIIELDRLPDRIAHAAPRGLLLENVCDGDQLALKRQALNLGVTVHDVAKGEARAALTILVADDETMTQLGAALESETASALGAAIRAVLRAYHRTEFILTFADGERVDLSAATRVLGILNVTPDSFSDGRSDCSPDRAAELARQMADDGADWVDVGGESTRPGAVAVPEDEEIRRVIPVVKAIKRTSRLRVSVDTMKAGVARRAIDEGADLLNDVSGFSDPEMLAVVRETKVPAIVMHMRGTPRTMQQNTGYADLLASVVGFLRDRVDKAVAAGVERDKLLVDPGLGFGKSTEGNLTILRELKTLRSIGCPLVIGASRKSFIGATLDLPVNDRLEGSLAIAAQAAWQGAHVIRTHDVSATKRTTRMIDAIRTI